MSRKLPMPSRQKKLDFAGANVWKQLPTADQQTCRQLLSLLMRELLLTDRKREHVHEPRKD